MKAPARRVSVIAREQWERKGRLFCLSGNTSSPPNCPEFLRAAAGFICGSFHFALKIFFPSACTDAVRISRKKKHFGAKSKGLSFWKCTEKDLKEYLSHC